MSPFQGSEEAFDFRATQPSKSTIHIYLTTPSTRFSFLCFLHNNVLDRDVRWLRQALGFTFTFIAARIDASPHPASALQQTANKSAVLEICSPPYNLYQASIWKWIASFKMSTPLVDIDANPRQPGFRSTKEGSKIPGPFKVQQVGGKDRSSPFSVSSTGSPCYNAVPTTSKAVVSSTSASRLPRKSTPVQNSFSRSYTYGSKSTTPRSSLPRCRDGLKQSASTAAPLPVRL